LENKLFLAISDAQWLKARKMEEKSLV
jgi:DTW domain-containing protein YfiP